MRLASWYVTAICIPYDDLVVFFTHFKDYIMSNKKRLCPECQCELFRYAEMREGVSVELDRCSKCGGVWMDAGEMELLTEADIHLYMTVAFSTIKQQILEHRSKEETNHGI